MGYAALKATVKSQQSNYTEEQEAIIYHGKGHALINSVPGSGKTHSLVGRVKHLIESGVSHRKIIVIMYNKAAEVDFYRRLKSELKTDQLPEVRTFHAMASRMLKRMVALEQAPNYRLEPNQMFLESLCRKTLQHFELDQGNSEVEALMDIIQWIKSRHDDQITFRGKVDGDEVKLFKQFEILRQEAKVRFFDDLLYDLVSTLKTNAKVAQLFRNRVDHIIIDEYQDINPCQQEIIKLVAGTRANVMVCGDVNQTIYKFRGSDPEFMLRKFAEDFDSPTHYHLSQTFRFGEKLSTFANRFITHNSDRFAIECRSNEVTGDTQIQFMEADNYKPATLIQEVIESRDAKYQDIAFLVREFAHAIPTEIELLKNEVPYRLEGSKGILAHPVIRSLFGYLRLADEAKHFKTIDEKDRLKLIAEMFSCPALFIKSNIKARLVHRLVSSPTNVNAFSELEQQLEEKQRKHISRREGIWDFCLDISSEDDAYLILKDLYHQLGFKSYFKFSSIKKEDAEYKDKLVLGILEYAKAIQHKHPTIGEFLAHVDQLKDSISKHKDNAVLITSMHRSKGLQWDYVVLPELLEGKMPPLNEEGEIDDIESERRILYVAMTRARKGVYLAGGNDLDKIEKAKTSNKIPKKIESSRLVYECYLESNKGE